MIYSIETGSCKEVVDLANSLYDLLYMFELFDAQKWFAWLLPKPNPEVYALTLKYILNNMLGVAEYELLHYTVITLSSLGLVWLFFYVNLL
ncbi:MAG: hypothetical protein R6U91_06600 [Bacillota bacterium]